MSALLREEEGKETDALLNRDDGNLSYNAEIEDDLESRPNMPLEREPLIARGVSLRGRAVDVAQFRR